MQCNWLAIVRDDGGARACVFCGQHCREHSKPLSVASVLALLDAQAPQLQTELVARSLRIVCQAALDSHARAQSDDGNAGFSACLCCHHWVARCRKKTLLFPLQALAWYVVTLRPVGGKHMDHRVVLRLCAVLAERGPLPGPPPGAPVVPGAVGAPVVPGAACDNHYSTLFTPQERALFADIAAHSVDSVGARITHHYH